MVFRQAPLEKTFMILHKRYFKKKKIYIYNFVNVFCKWTKLGISLLWGDG